MSRKKCTCCNIEKRDVEFYSSSSPFHRADGKLPMCKQCIWEYANVDAYMYDLERIKATLRMMDKPFIAKVFQSSVEESKAKDNKTDAFKLYMKNIAMKDFRELNWSHSDNSSIAIVNNPENNYEISKDEVEGLMNFFGKGFTIEDYLWLSDEYQDFKNRYESDSKGMELLIKQIVLTELDIEKRRASGEKVDAQLKTLQDLLGSSNLKPVQETGANAIEQETFGTLIKKWENEHPIPEPDEAWKDVDGISNYIKVFFTGHLARMLGKLDGETRDNYEKEMKKFTVEEPEKEDEDENEFV